MKIAEK